MRRQVSRRAVLASSGGAFALLATHSRWYASILMSDHGDTQLDVQMTRKPRRVAAILLSLLSAGLGHVAIGYWRRAIFWYGMLLCTWTAVFLSILLAAPWAMWMVIMLGWALQIVATVDVVLLPRCRPLPRPKLVGLVAGAVTAMVSVGPFLARTHIAEAFRVPNTSMYPTVERGDHIMTVKLAAGFTRGDVVVFRNPQDRNVRFVKRIVAVADDKLELRDGQLIVNDRPVARESTDLPCEHEADEGTCRIWRENLDGHSYRVAVDVAPHTEDLPSVHVPAGHVFVLGDHRDHSRDSRDFGALPISLAESEARFVWWSSGPEGVRWSRINQRVE
jgi:signal peptidase I